MYLSSHIAAGYLAGKLTGARGVIIALWVAGSLLPDMDGLWSHTVAGHHGLPHSPLFWIAVCGSGLALARATGIRFIQTASLVIFCSAMIHLITDWATARTVGIQWLYPLSETDFSLYQIEPARGDIPITDMLGSSYIYFYLENRLLAVSEIAINVIALLVFIRAWSGREKGR